MKNILSLIALTLFITTSSAYSAGADAKAAVAAAAAGASATDFPTLRLFANLLATDPDTLARVYTYTLVPVDPLSPIQSAAEAQTFASLALPAFNSILVNQKAHTFLRHMEQIAAHYKKQLKTGKKLDPSEVLAQLKAIDTTPGLPGFQEALREAPNTELLAGLVKEQEKRRQAALAPHVAEMSQATIAALNAFADRKKLRAENERLRALLAQAGVPVPSDVSTAGAAAGAGAADDDAADLARAIAMSLGGGASAGAGPGAGAGAKE